MKQFIGLILVFLQGIGLTPAQNDTAHRAIGEVAVVAGSTKYQYGAHVEQFDSLQLERVTQGSLTTLLQNMSGVYVKNYASGSASINLRGTGAEHTAVMVDGVNVNSLTTGQPDLGLIPIWLFDAISLQYGGASSTVGSDAIGGAISMNTKTLWNAGFKQQTKLETGSFGQQFVGEKLHWSDSSTSTTLRAFYTSCKNNFTFKNTAAHNFEKNSDPIDTQRNAAYQNFGLLLQNVWRISSPIEIGVKCLYTSNRHQVQPKMDVNYYGSAHDSLTDDYLLALANIRYGKNRLVLQYSGGFASSRELYFNDGSISSIATKQQVNNISGEYSLSGNSTLRLGSAAAYIKPEVYAYSDALSETRIEPYISFTQRLFQRIRYSANIRSAAVSGYNMPFAPSLGVECVVSENQHSKLLYRASVARGFKIPTFNQRFWANVGNPNLRPEYSWNVDNGLQFYSCTTAQKLQLSLTGYYLRINDLIQWIQLDVWRPVNVKSVESLGAEASAKEELSFGKIRILLGIQYSFNRATILHDSNNSNRDGKLLAYSPQHIGSLNFGLQLYGVGVSYIASYTDLRYTESNMQLPSYTISAVQTDYKIPINKHSLLFAVAVDNVFNTQYQNFAMYPLPGRAWRISFQYVYN